MAGNIKGGKGPKLKKVKKSWTRSRKTGAKTNRIETPLKNYSSQKTTVVKGSRATSLKRRGTMPGEKPSNTVKGGKGGYPLAKNSYKVGK